LKFLQSTTPFQNADKDEHASAPISISLALSLSHLPWRNHSYFIKLTDRLWLDLTGLGFYESVYES